MNFVKKNIYNVILSGILHALGMVIAILSARILGPNGVGHYQVFISTQSLITTVLSLGLGQASIYFINSKKANPKEVLSSIVKFYLPISLLVTIGTGLLIEFNASYFGETTLICLILFSASTTTLLFTNSLKPILLTNLKIGKMQVVSYVSQCVIVISILFAYIKCIELSIDEFLIISSIAHILSGGLLFWFLKEYIDFHIKFKSNLMRAICKMGIVMSSSNIAQLIFLYSPIYAFTWFYTNGFSEVGLYSRAISITTIATFTTQAIGPLLYSKMSKSSDSEKIQQTKVTATSFFIFNFIMFVIIEVFANQFIALLFGDEFMNAIPYLRIVAFSLFFNGIITVSLNVLSSKGCAWRVCGSILLGLTSLWIAMSLSSFFENPYLIAYCVVVANAITALCLSINASKVMNICPIDFIPTRSSQIKDVINILKRSII